MEMRSALKSFKLNLWALPFMVLGLLILHQNCGRPLSSTEVQQAENSESHSTEGGNGDAYDGKLYVVPGNCGLDSQTPAVQDKKAFLDSSAAVISVNEAFSQARLLRSRCKDLEKPQILNDGEIQWLGTERRRLLFSKLVFWDLNLIDPEKADVLSFSIEAHQNQVNLYNLAIEKAWRSGQAVHVTILSGVVVYSDSAGVPAFQLGNFPADTEVILINNGSIHGWRTSNRGDKVRNLGWEGGPALQLTSPSLVVNNGSIIGGAGSGGDVDMDRCCSVGDGGSVGGKGGTALITSASVSVLNSGSIHAGGGGGASGGGAWAADRASGRGGHGEGAFRLDAFPAEAGFPGVSDGGKGGAFGQMGERGGDAGNGWAKGGEGGFSIELNGNSVQLNGSFLEPNSSYDEATWITGLKGRIKP